MSDTEPTKYLVARISQALAEDDRTNALDVQVLFSGGKVFLMGEVACADRRDAAERVVREVLPSHTDLVNQLCVQTFTEPTEPERIA